VLSARHTKSCNPYIIMAMMTVVMNLIMSDCPGYTFGRVRKRFYRSAC